MSSIESLDLKNLHIILMQEFQTDSPQELSTNFFKNLSREEIYEDRKSKFLTIGRDKGFIKSSNFKDRGLSYDEPLVQKTIKHIILNKYIYGGISLIILIGIITTFN